MPRYIGTPSQLWCPDQFAFNSFEKTLKNKTPFFVSTYQYKDKNTPIIDSLFFDIDSYMGLRTPYRNVKRLRDYCRKMELSTITNFSGGKGFHFFIIFKPIIPKTDETLQKVKDLMYSVQMRFIQETGIEDYDEPTLGRTRFLVRYPTSLYLRKDDETKLMEKSGYYCRNLSDVEFDSGLKKICDVVTEPGEVPKTPKSSTSLIEIAQLFKNFKLLKRTEKQTDNMTVNRNGNEIPSITALGLPCLKELVKHSHPSHFERIELVSWLKLLGYSDNAICSFIKERNWTRYNYSTTSYQVKTIKPRLVKCSYLKQSYEQFCEKCTYKGRR